MLLSKTKKMVQPHYTEQLQIRSIKQLLEVQPSPQKNRKDPFSMVSSRKRRRQ